MQPGASGEEIKLYDPRRRPAHWTELLLPSQCAVIITDVSTLATLSASGQAREHVMDATCMVFERFDLARQFCERTVAALPNARCEIFDYEGLARPPLLVVLHPSHQDRDESSASAGRRRRVIAVLLLLGAIALVWFDWRHGWSSLIPTLIAINLVVAALRFAYWNFGLSQKERERARRLASHLRRECSP